MPNLLTGPESQERDYYVASSPEEQSWLASVRDRFLKAVDQRQAHNELMGMSPEEYWNLSQKNWLGQPINDANRQAWQAAVVKPVTRQKCVAH